jgi:K+-sensing histidine kinase KdpD
VADGTERRPPARPETGPEAGPDAGPEAGPDAGPTPLEVALGELERERRDRWIVGAVLVLAVVAAFAVLLLEGTAVATSPWVAVAFLAVTLLYGASVFFQEERSRRAIRALVDERERLGGLEARVAALETLHEVVRELVAARDLPDVFDRLLFGAIRLTGASSGAVLLRVGETLTVAASDGPGTPAVGARIVEDGGAAWEAVRAGSPQVAADRAEPGSGTGASTLAAPLQLPVAGEASAGEGAGHRVVGVLVVERCADAAAFTTADRLAAALFAQQAALAVRNASRLDRADERAAALEQGGESIRRANQAVVDELWGLVSSVTGTVQLLLHRGGGFPASRRNGLLDDLLEDTSRQRELLARLEELATSDDGSRAVPPATATPADG